MIYQSQNLLVICIASLFVLNRFRTKGIEMCLLVCPNIYSYYWQINESLDSLLYGYQKKMKCYEIFLKHDGIDSKHRENLFKCYEIFFKRYGIDSKHRENLLKYYENFFLNAMGLIQNIGRISILRLMKPIS